MADTYGVDKKTWRRWGEKGQDLFLSVYRSITAMGWEAFSSPKAPELTTNQFEVICHNAAFVAADEMSKSN